MTRGNVFLVPGEGGLRLSGVKEQTGIKGRPHLFRPNESGNASDKPFSHLLGVKDSFKREGSSNCGDKE
jgi:hypothetical protein